MFIWLMLMVIGIHILISTAIDRNPLMNGPTASILIILYGRKFVRNMHYGLGLFLILLSFFPLIVVLLFGFPHI
ncbi:hypothetical protein Pan241w_16080 [Gimesia alba]|uniref:NnrU protein n=1 Tax=Gimesia alba TaxID=2527973 RepID=A0A517RCE8_9PLAN|nr:hypothetical protein Pan241w_16080 [Gimesia alba]